MGEEIRPLMPLSAPADIAIPPGTLIALPQATAVVWLDHEDWKSMRCSCGSRQVLAIPESDSRSIVVKTKYGYTFLLKTDWCSRGLLPLPVDGSFVGVQTARTHQISHWMSEQESEELLQYAKGTLEPIVRKVRSNVGALLVLDFHCYTSLRSFDYSRSGNPRCTGICPRFHHYNRCSCK